MNCSTKYKQSAPFPFKQLFKDLMLQTSSISATFHHTSYLSFLLHWPHFRKPNFTPKKTTKGTKNTKNVSEKVKYMHFFHSIWKNLHLTENFYTGTACGASDKYEVWLRLLTMSQYHVDLKKKRHYHMKPCPQRKNLGRVDS